MIEAAQWLKDRVDAGEIPTDWDWANNHALFETGEAPFIMAGPWALQRIRESGIPYAITSFPDGGSPFAGTQGAFINAGSENALLAQAFLTEYIATQEVMQQLQDVGGRGSAFLPVREATSDPDLAAISAAGVDATMMPAIPAMGSVWGNWDSAIVQVRNGDAEPEAALTTAATTIRDLIANPLTGMVNVPGSYQAAAGCPGDWQPECAVTAMTQGEDGLWTSGPWDLPASETPYEFKVALDGSWTTNYGLEGAQDGANYTLTLDADSSVTFTFDPETHLLTWTVE
jgi:hypothetical protein